MPDIALKNNYKLTIQNPFKFFKFLEENFNTIISDETLREIILAILDNFNYSVTKWMIPEITNNIHLLVDSYKGISIIKILFEIY